MESNTTVVQPNDSRDEYDQPIDVTPKRLQPVNYLVSGHLMILMKVKLTSLKTFISHRLHR